MEVEQTWKKDKFRGKLYSLTPDSEWKDVGTGFIAIRDGRDDPPGCRRLVFHEEVEGKVLHDRPVAGEGTYQLQGEGERQTIIVWEDPQSHQDFAISFQEVTGTLEIWEALSAPASQAEKRLLPLPKMANLQALCRHLIAVPPSQREGIANECISPAFVSALRETFHTAEDLGSEEHLGQLWLIAKGIFLLSNQRLTERYLRHDIYEDVMGMLEYDEGLPRDKRLPHRQVLQVKVRFNDVLSMESQEIIERIHLNYRLQYLKDIVLPRLLDDASFVSLTQMIHFNLAAILDHLQSNKALVQRLFQQIRQKDLQSLAFLQDVCRLAKILPPGERAALYDKMLQEKLFEVLVPFLSMAVEEGATLNPRHIAVEVLLLSTLHDASHLRVYLTSSREKALKEFQDANHQGRQLLSELIQLLIVEVDQGVQSQIAELLKAVMDPSTLEFRERDTALDVFYDDGALEELARPLREGLPRRGPMRFAHQLICELMAFAVTAHGYRARVFIVRHGIGQQACRLFDDKKNRSQQLAPIRLLKAMVASKDDSYHRYLTKHGLFAPLMRSFQESLEPPGLGGNLLVSATLELLEMIRLENFKELVDHICKKHAQLLKEHVSKFKTLDLLFLRHQQNLEYEAFPPDQFSSGGPMQRGGREGQARPARQRSPGREDSDDDESYFESEDDDPVADAPDAGDNRPPAADAQDTSIGGQEASQPALKGLLLGYDDDEDEAPADASAPAAENGSGPGDAGAAAGAGGAAGAGEAAAGPDSVDIETEEPAPDASAPASPPTPPSPTPPVSGDAASTSEDNAERLRERLRERPDDGAEHIAEDATPSDAAAPSTEKEGKTDEEVAPSAEAEAPAAEEDGNRAPSAKAKAISFTLNHVAKRMKVNP